MELQPLVSIIIPVYGVEQYVDRAIQCIQDQSYENWELFLVDDGTKDRSGDICDEYAKEDGRIRVIHKENGGAPSARNTAL
ncbi:MAG: glycosyltransferase, partial [Clostridia bacterium]|nr:glycosyltransferase [Clostridia bacterium]